MNWKAKWIRPLTEPKNAAVIFEKQFCNPSSVLLATLTVTALGVYEARLNGKRVSDYVLAPGWTTYHKRLQYQTYDVTQYIANSNVLEITVGKGWYRGDISGRLLDAQKANPCAILAQLELTFENGNSITITSDSAWTARESQVRYSEIYHGEVYDSTFVAANNTPCVEFDGPWHTLIPQEGEKITEHERIAPVRILDTPNGERVIDFGQNISGYVQLHLYAKAGERIKLSHGEVLDSNGNFYNANYRAAKAELCYICKDGIQTYRPVLTFYGFRYVRIDEFPGGIERATADMFTAIAVYSDIKRTGYLSCSNPLLNKFFNNVIWGQKCNFLDIPTDCPQRDERLGWTGDAQVFIRTAALNFDVEKFFYKWLGCMEADQLEDGYIGHMIPDTWRFEGSSAAWGDAAIICPWELYMAYGDLAILEKQYNCMKKRIDYIANDTSVEDLWIGGTHFGDWLALDGIVDPLRGSSREDFIASAFYAHSTSLFVKIGRLLGKNVFAYEKLHARIVKKFRQAFPDCRTQTECALAVHFRLAEDCQAAANQLAQMVRDAGMQLKTGFVGTPYLLHALSDFGYTDIAYSLLLREEYPSWLYAVKKGATTVWEHWDSLREDGSFWDTSMNSFNHYAYGAVTDWVYCVAAGIRYVEAAPGYQQILFAPHPDSRLDWLKAELDTRNGKAVSYWQKENDYWRYEITTPVKANVLIGGVLHVVEPGTHYFYSERSC